MKLFACCVSVVLLLLTAPVFAQEPPPGSDYEGQAFTFHKVVDGIYHAVGTGGLAVGCNGAVVVNENDVLIVDSHMTPAAAWALREELKEITDKPIRYVVNTHFHFDHAHGNQVFGPEVEIIAHSFTRQKLASGESRKGRAWESFVLPTPGRIAEAEEELESLEGDEHQQLAERIAGMKSYWAATQSVVPTAPTLTLDQRMVLHRGGREIQLLFSGRGHTGGDVVVFLPAERVLITGDLLTEGIPYMGDSFPVDWVETLEAVKALDFEHVLPGHGKVFRGKAKLSHLQEYLRDLWIEAAKARGRGLSAEQAAREIDLGHHADHFPDIEGPGVSDHAVARIFELMAGDS